MSFKEKVDYIFYRFQKVVPTTRLFEKECEMLYVLWVLGKPILIHRDNIEELYLKLDEYCETYQSMYLEMIYEELQEGAIDNGKRKS